MAIDWGKTHAAIWRPRRETLRPVAHIDPIRLDQLIGIDDQADALFNNTERFLTGRPANNALLWGARGTGKSSLIKAVFNELRHRGLRLIEVDKNDLMDLPEIVDDIRQQSQRFILFCDDLSFSEAETDYRALKRVLEGSIELPPDNVLVYATSNRRHLVPERMEDNRDTTIVDGELHYGDAVEEKISLSDRFGLWLSFYSASQVEYLELVDAWFPNFSGDRQTLHQAALRFALARGSRSGRIARQFYNSMAEGDGGEDEV